MSTTEAKPTIKEMLECWRSDETDTLIRESDEVFDTNRHGSDHQFVAKRKYDETHWSVRYRVNQGADYNDFREGDLDDSDVKQVFKKTRTEVYWSFTP